MTRTLTNGLVGLFLLLLTALAPAAAQEVSTGDPLPQPLAGWQADLQRIGKALTRTYSDDDALVGLREQLEALREESRSYIDGLDDQFADIDSQLKKLGPAPKEGERSESEAAARVRKDLTARAADLDGAIRTAEVLQTQAAQLSGSVQDKRRKLFSRQLLKRAQSPFKPDVWVRVANEAGQMLRGLGYLANDWWSGLAEPWLVFALLAAAAALGGILANVSARLVSRYRAIDDDAVPLLLHRVTSAAGVTLARTVPLVLAACLLVFGLWSLDMLPGTTEGLAFAGLQAFCVVVALMALVKTVLAPNQHRWRILPATDENARRLRNLAWSVAIIYGLDQFLDAVETALVAPIQISVAQSFVTTVAVAGLLAAMLRTPLGATENGSPGSGTTLLGIVRGLLWVLVIAILTAAGLGYIALARFLITQIVVTGSILILVWLLHVTIDEFTASLSDPERSAGRWFAANFPIAPQRHGQAGIVISFLLHVLLALLVVPVLALQWGFDREDLRFWMSKVIFGFELGNWHISLATIFLALLLLVAGLFATRFFQRWLDNRVLARANFDQGARSAIRTAVGYLGVAVAGVVAISYAGVDFSNVAIVAGALSVGIGFGLQSIVNNFVSGLILLAERRVSVGDWIVVGEEEGFVRRISVRATEIETFDRNFVIIPNSELMSNAVKNWTFQHRRARIILDVGVSYDADPEHVREVITRITHEHPKTLYHDQTQVWFHEFGDSALVFRLKAFVGDVLDLINTRSDLRYAIAREFRKEGIEIPFPQRDIHLKDIDRLEAAISGKKATAKRSAPAATRRRAKPKPQA